MKSNEVLQELWRLLGDSSPIKKEVLRFMKKRDIDPETLTLTQLREVIAAYTRDVLLKVKTKYQDPAPTGGGSRRQTVEASPEE